MTRNELPLLFKLFPQLSGRIPWRRLGNLPTQVHPLYKLGKHLNFNHLYIKRDDRSGRYGGNKVRKLEFLLEDVAQKVKQGVSEVFTYGAIGSHHVLASLFYSREYPFDITPILCEQPLTPHVFENLSLIQKLAKRIEYLFSPNLVPFSVLFRTLLSRYADKNRLIIPPGGSTPLGCLGFVNAIGELKSQIEAGLLPEPDYIFIPLGSGGTMAGLEIGVRLFSLKTKIIGIGVIDKIVTNRFTLTRLINRTIQLLRNFQVSIPYLYNPYQLTILDDFLGQGYGHSTDQSQKAIDLLYDLEGIPLETTYSGKALSAIVFNQEIRNLPDSVVLFWNTFNSNRLENVFSEQIPRPS